VFKKNAIDKVTIDENGDVRVYGNLTVNGIQTIMNTDVGTTERLVITNDGTGPALEVNQIGNAPVVDFKDDGVSALTVVNGGNVGIGTTDPQAKLHVNGLFFGSFPINYFVKEDSTNAGGYMTFVFKSDLSCSTRFFDNYNASAGGFPCLISGNYQILIHIYGLKTGRAGGVYLYALRITSGGSAQIGGAQAASVPLNGEQSLNITAISSFSSTNTLRIGITSAFQVNYYSAGPTSLPCNFAVIKVS